jgi:hypothetical protein
MRMRSSVRWLGAWLALMCAAGCACAHDLVATARDESGAPLADAVVVAVPTFPVKLPPPHRESVVQEAKEFRPFVKAVLVGTPVEFPNRDDVLHHVYSFSPVRAFELKAYAGTPPEPIVFDKPGAVALGCNIHDWMLAYIYVSESPFFGVSGADGKVRLSRLAPGTYAVRIWHPREAVNESETVQSVVVGPEADAQVQWQLKLKRDVRIRRAPTRSGGSYR